MFFFLPFGTDRPCWRRPYATYALIVLCAIVFAIQVGAPESLPEGFVPSEASLWDWFLAMFMHAGIMHLAGNMLFLWLFGSIAEDVLGPKLFLLFYFGGNLGATALDLAMGSVGPAEGLMIPRVGASGAIAGIMGLASVCFLRTKVRVWYAYGYYISWGSDTVEVPAPLFLGLWVGWEVLMGLLQAATEQVGGTAHWAHVGGFGLGLGAALAFRLHKRVPRADLVQGREATDSRYAALDQAGRLQEVVRESPDDGEAWLALGRDYEIAGRFAEAKGAYERALPLFLAANRGEEAAKAYAGLSEYGGTAGLTPQQEFHLACCLEQAGQNLQACSLFEQVAATCAEEDRREISLLRAGEVARSALGDPRRAAGSYRRLLAEHPFGNWTALARQRLREMGLPEQAPPPPPSPSAAAAPEPDGLEVTMRRLREDVER